MKLAFMSQSKLQRRFAHCKQILLVGLSLVTIPNLLWQQQTSKALAVEVNSVAVNSGWSQASFPVENFQAYTSPFGYRHIGSSWEFHRGLDMAAPEGSYIRNWWAGTVLQVSDGTACGTYIVIQSGEWQHTYCHMEGHVETADGHRYLIDREGGIQMAEGQQIAAGTRIGRVGMTGHTTGPHLHWALKYDGNSVDPALVLRAMYAQQSSSTSRTAAIPKQSSVSVQVSKTIGETGD